MKFMGSYVYMITNKRNGTIYTGVTSDLKKRIWEHKNKVAEGFSNQYDLNMLVWFEVHDDIEQAIIREKQIKKWNRNWKLEIIESMNPSWNDLYDSI